MRPRQNGLHFPDDIFKCIHLNENAWIAIKISLKFVPTVSINNIPAMVQIMAYNNNYGPNGHLFYVGGDLMMRRGMLPIIMLPDGDLRIVLHLVPFWILTIWGSVHIEETVVGWRNQLRMKTPVT